MNIRTITLCLCILSSGLLMSCRDEKTTDSGYNHLATPYEDGDFTGVGGDDDDDDTVGLIDGGWLNIGDPPAIYFEIDASETSFDFVPIGNWAAHEGDYAVDYFTNNNFATASGTIDGANLTWSSSSGSNTASFVGTFAGTNDDDLEINGTFTVTYLGNETTHTVQLQRPTTGRGLSGSSTQGTGTNLVDPNIESYILDADNTYIVVRTGVYSQAYFFGRVMATNGDDIDTWAWMFNSDGDLVDYGDADDAGGNYDVDLQPFIFGDTYYLVVTSFDTDTQNIDLSLTRMVVNINN